jgi:hypothetical protein
MCLRLEGLELLKPGTWDLLKEMGFKPESAKKLLGLRNDGQSSRSFARRFSALIVQGLEKGLLSVGQVARQLGTDIAGVQDLIEEFTTQAAVDSSGEWKQIALDLSQELSTSSRG